MANKEGSLKKSLENSLMDRQLSRRSELGIMSRSHNAEDLRRRCHQHARFMTKKVSSVSGEVSVVCLAHKKKILKI